MLRYLTIALGALAATTMAQSKTEEDKPTTTSSSGSTTHTVRVGWTAHRFSPNVTHAEKGDVVEFEFYPPDHSVVRGVYDYGCIPYEKFGENQVGFYSGQHIFSGIVQPLPKFQIKVNDTEPIFYYCGAEGSCKGSHMVGVINPTEEHSLEGHVAIVEQAEFELLPGEPWPSESEIPDDAKDAPSKPDSSSDRSEDSDKSDDKKDGGGSGLSAGAIAGIAIGGAAVLIIAAALIYLCGRRGGLDLGYRRSVVPGGGPHAGGFVGGPGGPGMEHKALTPMTMGGEGWGTPSPGLTAYPSSPGYGQYAAVPLAANATGSTFEGDPRVGSAMTSPGLAPPAPAPVELPASGDPGNSPLPGYSNQRFSWNNGAESEYRPGK